MTADADCDQRSRLFTDLERRLSDDPGGRGVVSLVVAGDLRAACETLAKSSRVAIATGFWIPGTGACETDGPTGALELGAGLMRLGAQVIYFTDEACAPTLERLSMSPLLIDGPDLSAKLREFAPTHLVAVERLGRAADGRYYTMRGVDNTERTSALDRFFGSERPNCRTIGIGDGGNEIGMGKVRDRVAGAVKNGSLIASIIATDSLVVAGVSNWGAWGLLAGMSAIAGNDLMPTVDEAAANLNRLVAAGAVDGVTGKREPTVDGIPWESHQRVLESLRNLAERASGKADSTGS